MITITRRQARCLRGVFRRSVLGIAHRGPVPPLVLVVEGGQLCARHRHGALAVEHASPCAWPSSGSVALPLDALADLEGKDDATVALEAIATERTIARWPDRGIPRSREYPVPAIESLGRFPTSPGSWSEVPAALLDALAEATATAADDDTRYALSCLLLKRGRDGHEVVATDGRQVLIRGGFRLPWAGDVLVRRSPLFASAALPRDRPWSVGRADSRLVLRGGPWTIWLEEQADARFPRVEMAFPAPDAATSRLRLDPADAAFLAEALGRLPGADLAHAPVTVELNGQVAVRARGEGAGPATELVLSRSGYSGTPVRFRTDREFLARACRLGFPEVEVVDPASPIACRDGSRAYAWQPLDVASAIGPADDAVTIESGSRGPAEVPLPPGGGPGASTPGYPAGRPGAARGPREGPGPAAVDPATPGLAALIAEAGALHRSLAEARSRAVKLAVALRKHRRRERLVQATLPSPRQLRPRETPG